MSKCLYKSVPSLKDARIRNQKISRKTLDEIFVPSTLKEFAKDKKFYIRTYGCQANVRDDEIMAGYLLAAGFERTFDENQANVIVINTCAVRENAEDKCYGEVGSYKARCKTDKDLILCVCGCMMQEENMAQRLMRTFPYLSLIFGTHNISNILNLLNEVVSKHKRIIDVKSYPGDVIEGLPSSRLSTNQAFVNITYGCDKFCTYCIVPYTRGKERSRYENDIINECKELVEQGYKEITLLGQNVNSYGLDLDDGSNFATLLDKVAELGIPRLKFLTSYPSQFTDEMIDVMAKHKNIAPWLHLPVQSGSNSCLRRMGRRYTREEYLDLVKRIKTKVPNISLTTDIIVGFTNETEEEFLDTLSLCEEVQYSAAFTFIYSAREGTPAARIPNNLSQEVIHERFVRLGKVIEESTKAHSEAMVGNVYQVLVEGPSKKDPNVLSGYAENGKLINFVAPQYLVGTFTPVKVIESHAYSLFGELVEEPIITKARDCSYLVEQEPAIKEYLRLKEIIDNSPMYKEFYDRMIEIKKELSELDSNSEEFTNRMKEYKEITNKFKNDPVLSNLVSLQDEVTSILLEVKEILK